MAVGQQLTKDIMDAALTGLALQLRNVATSIIRLNKEVNGTGNGAGVLQAAGYTAGDAATALTLLGYLDTIAGCYAGTVQQGGTDGSGAIKYDFDNALSVLWGGQI